MANLASMLPSVPKSFGRLSEAYLSAFLALLGKSNPLRLAFRESYVVILVDGLGSSNIRDAGGHTPFLNQKLSGSKSLYSGFPTTTATSLASFATGEENGTHGFIGYRVFDRDKARAINLLNDLGNELEPGDYQDLETISEKALAENLRVLTIGSAEYAVSGFTRATMPAATYLSAATITERFELAIRELKKPGTLIYLYVPELDQLGHRFGVKSRNWLNEAESLDSVISKFIKELPTSAGAVLTADHGVIDVPKTNHVYLDEFSSLEKLLMLGGDPRVGFLYFEKDTDIAQTKSQIAAELNGLCEVVSISDLIDAGWIAPLSKTATRLCPDLVLLPKGERVVYHRAFAKKKSLEMVGQHGGMLKQEWEVPLLVW